VVASDDTQTRVSRFTRYAWAFLAYLLLVILFGAWVRITHSGAGCGSHWPTCHGEIVPLAPSIETVIEYTHRLTSGLLGIFGLVLVGWAVARHGRDRVTFAAVLTMVFIMIEALIGAGLVLRELVADDDSTARAVVIAIHLVNTLILTAAAGLTAWWSWDRRPLRPAARPTINRVLALGILAVVLTAMTGAVTALGDTLFPVEATGGDVLARVRDDLSATRHFLVRLRIVHPVVAVATAALLLWISSWVARAGFDATSRRVARGLKHAVAAEVVVGVANIGLAAPGWLQLVHLLLAQLVWLATVLTLVACWAARDRSV
jgi:heme a synthase